MPRTKLIGGSDALGGVGFGIPADTTGGKPAKPDNVITEHNASAKLVQATLAELEDIESISKGLSPDSPVKSRIDATITSYKIVFNKYIASLNKVTEQKLVLVNLLPTLSTIANGIRQREDEWYELPLFYTDQIQSQLRTWCNAMLNVFNGFSIKPDDVSNKITEFCNQCLSINLNTETLFSDAHGTWQRIKDIVDDLIESISPATEKGFGTLQKAHTQIENEYKSQMVELNRAKTELKSAVLSTEKQNQSENLTEAVMATPTSTAVIPDNVPNYTLAIPNSPRICASCRFFKWSTERAGKCTAFDFEAEANHVCDVWQAINLSEAKTIVRNDEPVNNKQLVTENPTIYEQDLFANPNKSVTDTSETFTEQASDISQTLPPTDNLKAAEKIFMPGDIVYSKSLRTFATIEAITDVDDQKMFSLKLIDVKGVAWGTGFTYKSDLSHKLQNATKSQLTPNAEKSVEDELQQMIQIVRGVYKSLKVLVDEHADIVARPLSNKEILSPLQEHLIAIMRQPLFQNVTTGRKRKYYRAMQNATYGVGASRQMLFKSFKQISEMQQDGSASKSEMRNIMLEAQNAAYDILKDALKQITDTLILPSATHDTPAPGYKVIGYKSDSQISEDIRNILLEQTSCDSLTVEPLGDGAVTATLRKNIDAEDSNVAFAELDKIQNVVNNIGQSFSLTAMIISSDVQRISPYKYKLDVKLSLTVK